MTANAKAIKTLYTSGRVSIAGVKKAVTSGVITKDEYLKITGVQYK